MSSGAERLQSPFYLKNTSQNTATNGSIQIGMYQDNSTFENLTRKVMNLEYVELQRKIFNKLGYFGITTTKIIRHVSCTEQSYKLTSNTVCALLIYIVLHINVTIKGIFLCFVIMEYFGPVVFLDKIASLDFVLCIGLVGIGASMLLSRYPFYGKKNFTDY